MLYDKFLEKAVEIGDIGVIGVVSETNSTAVMFAGCKVLKKYHDGTKQMSLTLQITGMAGIESQKGLTLKLCGIIEKLVGGKWEIEGAQNIKCKAANFPVPTVKNERYWIYSCSVNITFYTEEEIWKCL